MTQTPLSPSTSTGIWCSVNPTSAGVTHDGSWHGVAQLSLAQENRP